MLRNLHTNILFCDVSKVSLRNADLRLRLKVAVSLVGNYFETARLHISTKTTKAHSLLLLNIFLQNMHRITS